MPVLDIGVGLLMLLGSIRSYFRGLTREVMSTLGLIAVFIFAIWGEVLGQRYVEPVIASPWWRQIALYTALLLVAIGAYVLWAYLVERMLYASRLSIPDRALGSLFGIVKVGVVLAALLVLLVQAAPDRIATAVSGSALAPPLLQTARVMTAVLPSHVKHEFQRAYQRVRQQSAPSPKAPTDISRSDDRALRQLIEIYAKEP